MAKGFTVKSAAAKAKKQAETPEWDYTKAKGMIKGKTVYFVYQVEEYHIHF